MPRSEAFSRTKIDALLRDVGWPISDGVTVLFEHPLPDGTRADYVLCDRAGRPLAVLEAKRASTAPLTAQDQGKHYARLLGVPFVFLSNGDEVWFLDTDIDAHARKVATVFSQEDLERRAAVRKVRRDPLIVEIDRAIAGRDYQVRCIDTLCQEISRGRRKLLVEMATGTGKTRTAAAFIKRLFEAGQVTRVLFLVDRITLHSSGSSPSPSATGLLSASSVMCSRRASEALTGSSVRPNGARPSFSPSPRSTRRHWPSCSTSTSPT